MTFSMLVQIHHSLFVKMSKHKNIGRVNKCQECENNFDGERYTVGYGIRKQVVCEDCYDKRYET